MASNTNSGVVYDLADTAVSGGLFVGAGGDPTSLIAKSGNTTVASQSALSSPIDVEDFEVPNLPPGEGDGTSTAPTDTPTRVTFGGLTVNPRSDGSFFLGNSCFTMTIQPNGDFRATENPGAPFVGGNLVTEGNINDLRNGGSPTVSAGSNKNGGTGFAISADSGAFGLHGSWHNFKIDSSGYIEADLGRGGR